MLVHMIILICVALEHDPTKSLNMICEKKEGEKTTKKLVLGHRNQLMMSSIHLDDVTDWVTY